VTQQPERLNVYTLAALCDLLECGVAELIEPVVEQRAQRKRAAGAGDQSAQKRVRDGLRPVRARIVDPDEPPKA
jgi:hypothetical protein